MKDTPEPIAKSPTEFQPQAARWPEWFSWSALVGVALVVYEMTTQTGLAAAVGCSKFGWNDFLTARWLRRNDPDPRRGRALAWSHRAFGLWKITAAAFAAIMLIVAIDEFLLAHFRPPAPVPPEPSDTFKGIAITVAGGLYLSLVATHIAFWSAWLTGRKIWLSLGTHRARRENEWLPAPSGGNWAGAVLELSGIVTLLGTFLGSIGLAILLVQKPDAYLWPVSMFLLAVGHYAFGATTGKRMVQSVIAATPADCWPPEQTAGPLP